MGFNSAFKWLMLTGARITENAITAIQKFRLQTVIVTVKLYSFAFCFVWAWNLVARTEGGGSGGGGVG